MGESHRPVAVLAFHDRAQGAAHGGAVPRLGEIGDGAVFAFEGARAVIRPAPTPPVGTELLPSHEVAEGSGIVVFAPLSTDTPAPPGAVLVPPEGGLVRLAGGPGLSIQIVGGPLLPPLPPSLDRLDREWLGPCEGVLLLARAGTVRAQPLTATELDRFRVLWAEAEAGPDGPPAGESSPPETFGAVLASEVASSEAPDRERAPDDTRRALPGWRAVATVIGLLVAAVIAAVVLTSGDDPDQAAPPTTASSSTTTSVPTTTTSQPPSTTTTTTVAVSEQAETLLAEGLFLDDDQIADAIAGLVVDGTADGLPTVDPPGQFEPSVDVVAIASFRLRLDDDLLAALVDRWAEPDGPVGIVAGSVDMAAGDYVAVLLTFAAQPRQVTSGIRPTYTVGFDRPEVPDPDAPDPIGLLDRTDWWVDMTCRDTACAVVAIDPAAPDTLIPTATRVITRGDSLLFLVPDSPAGIAAAGLTTSSRTMYEVVGPDGIGTGLFGLDRAESTQQ